MMKEKQKNKTAIVEESVFATISRLVRDEEAKEENDFLVEGSID